MTLILFGTVVCKWVLFLIVLSSKWTVIFLNRWFLTCCIIVFPIFFIDLLNRFYRMIMIVQRHKVIKSSDRGFTLKRDTRVKKHIAPWRGHRCLTACAPYTRHLSILGCSCQRGGGMEGLLSLSHLPSYPPTPHFTTLVTYNVRLSRRNSSPHTYILAATLTKNMLHFIRSHNTYCILFEAMPKCGLII